MDNILLITVVSTRKWHRPNGPYWQRKLKNIYMIRVVNKGHFRPRGARHHDGADAVHDQPGLPHRPAQGALRHRAGLVPANELLLLHCDASRVRWSALFHEG